MPVTINEMHTDVVADGTDATAPVGTSAPAPQLTTERWQELQQRVLRDHCRTTSIDFED